MLPRQVLETRFQMEVKIVVEAKKIVAKMKEISRL